MDRITLRVLLAGALTTVAFLPGHPDPEYRLGRGGFPVDLPAVPLRCTAVLIYGILLPVLPVIFVNGASLLLSAFILFRKIRDMLARQRRRLAAGQHRP
jgi:hypothetical protein